jgi:hypothetical protein
MNQLLEDILAAAVIVVCAGHAAYFGRVAWELARDDRPGTTT